MVRSTHFPGKNHNQYIYALNRGACGLEYEANGSGVHRRECTDRQGGALGLAPERQKSPGLSRPGSPYTSWV